jgi:hypothetical protein
LCELGGSRKIGITAAECALGAGETRVSRPIPALPPMTATVWPASCDISSLLVGSMRSTQVPEAPQVLDVVDGNNINPSRLDGKGFLAFVRMRLRRGLAAVKASA